MLSAKKKVEKPKVKKKATKKNVSSSPVQKSLSEGIPPNHPDDPRQVTLDQIMDKAMAKSSEDQDQSFTEAVVEVVREDAAAVLEAARKEVESARTVLADVEIQLTEAREANATLRRRNGFLQEVVDASKPFRDCALETEEDGKIVRCNLCQGCNLDVAVKAYRENA